MMQRPIKPTFPLSSTVSTKSQGTVLCVLPLGTFWGARRKRARPGAYPLSGREGHDVKPISGIQPGSVASEPLGVRSGAAWVMTDAAFSSLSDSSVQRLIPVRASLPRPNSCWHASTWNCPLLRPPAAGRLPGRRPQRPFRRALAHAEGGPHRDPPEPFHLEVETFWGDWRFFGGGLPKKRHTEAPASPAAPRGQPRASRWARCCSSRRERPARWG